MRGTITDTQLDNRIKAPLTGQLPGPPLKLRCGPGACVSTAGLAGQLPGPPLKAREGERPGCVRCCLAGQLPGPPLKPGTGRRHAEVVPASGRATTRPSIEAATAAHPRAPASGTVTPCPRSVDHEQPRASSPSRAQAGPVDVRRAEHHRRLGPAAPPKTPATLTRASAPPENPGDTPQGPRSGPQAAMPASSAPAPPLRCALRLPSAAPPPPPTQQTSQPAPSASLRPRSLRDALARPSGRLRRSADNASLATLALPHRDGATPRRPGW